jgi:hypothetical protein
MSVIADFLENVQNLLGGRREKYHPGLFTDRQYLIGEVCHTLVMELLTEAALSLPAPVAYVSTEKEHRFPDQGRRKLHGGWEPDIVLWNAAENPLAFVEYESLNSSDERVFEKDVWKYSRWQPNPGIGRAPLLIITTLKDGLHPGYKLEHGYNWRHKGNGAAIRENPFRYWYRVFRSKIYPEVADLDITFANFSENVLSVVDINLRQEAARNTAQPPTPITEEEWNCTWPETPQGVINIREQAKRLLEGKVSLAEIDNILEAYWEGEQAAWEMANQKPWARYSEKGFFKDAERVRNWQDAVRVIVNVEWDAYL